MAKITARLLSLLLAVSIALSLSACSLSDFLESPEQSADGGSHESGDGNEENNQENGENSGENNENGEGNPQPESVFSPDMVPAYSGSPYVAINGNTPFFDGEDTSHSYETYSALDSLGRCGVAISCIGKELLPTEERGDISSVLPTGWHSVRYNGSYLYHRAHLIGFQLTAENANERNLITGTAYFNVTGMLPFENMVADYLEEEPDAHVLYRVTPVFDGDNLVANGVLMEAMSVEDEGDSILFCVFVYNVQPGVHIDYKTGESHLEGETPNQNDKTYVYVLNKNSKKFHYSTCTYAENIAEKNYGTLEGTREDALAAGYSPCGVCNP